MLLDVLGLHAHYTEAVSEWCLLRESCSELSVGNLLKQLRGRDRCLKLFTFNEECLLRARHQRALNTSLPFVHTARRCS